MKSVYLVVLFLIVGHFVFSQETDNIIEDTFYKEDHYYLGVTYNLLGNTSNGIMQSGLSAGLHLGYVKDMPINKKRNVAFAVGIGYSANTFNQNIFLNQEAGSDNLDYRILSDKSSYTKNKLSVHLVELPIEFRWRTSTPLEYDFWRIYTGFKLGYGFSHQTKYIGDLGVLKYNKAEGFNELQYGITLSAGYSKWNLHLYYGLNPIFSEKAKVNGDRIKVNSIKIGLMLYLL